MTCFHKIRIYEFCLIKSKTLLDKNSLHTCMGLPGPGKDLPCDTRQHIHNLDANGLLGKYSECEGGLFARLKSCLEFFKKYCLLTENSRIRRFIKKAIILMPTGFLEIIRNVKVASVPGCLEYLKKY